MFQGNIQNNWREIPATDFRGTDLTKVFWRAYLAKCVWGCYLTKMIWAAIWQNALRGVYLIKFVLAGSMIKCVLGRYFAKRFSGGLFGKINVGEGYLTKATGWLSIKFILGMAIWQMRFGGLCDKMHSRGYMTKCVWAGIWQNALGEAIWQNNSRVGYLTRWVLGGYLKEVFWVLYKSDVWKPPGAPPRENEGF